MQLKKIEEMRQAAHGGTEQERKLLHDAVMRTEARYDAEQAKERRLAVNRAIQAFFMWAGLIMAIGLGGAWYLGMLDATISRLGLPLPLRGSVETPVSEKVRERPGKAGVSVKQPVSVEVKWAVDKIENGIDDYLTMEERFRSASFAYWKDVRPEDKPSKSKPPLTYVGLVPDGNGGRSLYCLSMGGGRPMTVQEVNKFGDRVNLTNEEFGRRTASTPYLVLRGDRAYYCSPGKKQRNENYPLPAADGLFNPAHTEFGALLEQMKAVKMTIPNFRYKVFLDLPNFQKRVLVKAVDFGHGVGRAEFARVARSLVDDDEVCKTLMATGRVWFEVER